jgi:hypothetical protein
MHESRKWKVRICGWFVPVMLQINPSCLSVSQVATISPIGIAKFLVDIGSFPMWMMLLKRLLPNRQMLTSVLTIPVAVYYAFVNVIRYAHFFVPGFDPSG